jgi:FkbH-like protein
VLSSKSGSNYSLQGETQWWQRVWSTAWRCYAALRSALGIRADADGDLGGAFRHLRAAAHAGFPEAQFRLGGCYERGRGVVRSPGDAAEWYRRAALTGHLGAEFALSLMYLHGQGVGRTSAWYRAAKQSDEIAALRNRQTLFPHGIEIPRDYEEALHWSRAAARGGRIEAQANTGLLLLQGLGCTPEYAEAFQWLTMAADNGNAEAQYGMGMLYARGLGVEADMAEACRWYEAAAAQDHGEAQVTLGYLYGFDEAMQRDPERAKHFLSQASDRGNASAPYYLGLLYLRDSRNSGDLAEIEGCFLRSAQRGHVPAMLALANLYMRQDFGRANSDRAEIWYRAAAEAGDAEARFQLGTIYAARTDASGHAEAALRHYREAAEQGHALAQHNCAEMLLAGGDAGAAAHWFAAAAAQGVAESQLVLGDLYARGRGVPRGLQIARDWYEKAASNGLRNAVPKLERSTRLLVLEQADSSAADAVQIVHWGLDDASLNRAFGSVVACVEIIGKLAQRGVISLIRSNDFMMRAKPDFVHHALWEQFVFPLPDRESPLGDLVAICDGAIVPLERTLLVDDRPTERADAVKRGLQVAGSSIASNMLADPRFAGIDDPTLVSAVRSILIEETVVNPEENGPSWYRIAAEDGNAEAQSIFAWALLTGDGCVADSVLAFSWFKKSAEAGFAAAQLQLGIMYRDGVGTPVDEELSSDWLQRAADAGSDEARALLDVASSAAGPGGQAGPAADAVPWYRTAAEAGGAEAQCILAWACLTGDNCEQDEAMAAFWFEKSARAGWVGSQLQLGSMYYEGVGVPQHHEKAAAWLRLAAEAGDGEAQFRIACMFWRGEGIARDRAAALDWYRKAAQSGKAEAQAFIDSQMVEKIANAEGHGDSATALPSSPSHVAGALLEAEPVRLVIWDLDETFWRGTLAEGGIEAYIQANHDLVVTLAERGIMNSICSRNDFAAVRRVLEECGLWHYFIFPSIDWTAKGERIAAIVESTQLRAPTVLFVDDNPLNRASVTAAVPGIQVAGPDFLDRMIEDRLFKGKDDRKLSRLAQYKLLEKRQVDRQATEGGDEQFLRNANIRVIIDTDIAANLDRTIELINRTNQLNFTKRRLPDTPEGARAQLQEELSPFYCHAGLVRVIDNYGDYGYCGYYRLEGDRLLDYCFSCRILGMGVESWLYERLGRPQITVAGEVLTDLSQQHRLDWIKLITDDGAAVAVAERVIPEVRLRGGCDLDALAHYFRLVAEVVRSETNRSRPPLFVRMDTTTQLTPALDGMRATFRESVARLGFAPDDFDSEFLAPVAAGSILVYSPWGDLSQAIYRHRTEGFYLPVNVEIHSDLTCISHDDLIAGFTQLKLDETQRAKITSIVEILRSDYSYESLTPLPVALDIIRRLFDRIPPGAQLYLILPHEWYKDGNQLLPRAQEYNEAVRRLAADYAAVTLVSMNDVVFGAGEMQDTFDHFDRVVYFRLYQKIMQAFEAGQVCAGPDTLPS